MKNSKVPTLTFVSVKAAREVLQELTLADELSEVFACTVLPLDRDTYTVGSTPLTMLVRRIPGTPPVMVDENRDRTYRTLASFPAREQEFGVGVLIPARTASTESAILKASPDALDILNDILEDE